MHLIGETRGEGELFVRRMPSGDCGGVVEVDRKEATDRLDSAESGRGILDGPIYESDVLGRLRIE